MSEYFYSTNDSGLDILKFTMSIDAENSCNVNFTEDKNLDSILGSCCLPSGICINNITKIRCEENGGIFYTESCDAIDCPIETPGPLSFVYDLPS